MASFNLGNIVISVEHISETEELDGQYYLTMDNGQVFRITEELFNEVNEILGS